MLLLDKPFHQIARDLELFAEREQMGINALAVYGRTNPSPLVERALAESLSAVETAHALASLFRRWESIEEMVRDAFAGIGALQPQWLAERARAVAEAA